MSAPSSLGGSFRLIVDGVQDAAANMAEDEALLERYANASTPPEPTLRLYGWSPPALSLGSKQPARGAHDPSFIAQHGIDLVRRPTGGRAVLHEHERTYSVIAAAGRSPFPGGVVDTYARIARALVAGLLHLGVQAEIAGIRRDPGPAGSPVCFEHPGQLEILARGRKLIGSAQLRRRGAFLQHGSIPIRADRRRLAAAVGVPPDASGFTDLETEIGRSITIEELDRALVGGFTEAFATPVLEGRLSREEALRAAELRCWKYDSAAWTYEGKIGHRERRWGPAIS